MATPVIGSLCGVCDPSPNKGHAFAVLGLNAKRKKSKSPSGEKSPSGGRWAGIRVSFTSPFMRPGLNSLRPPDLIDDTK